MGYITKAICECGFDSGYIFEGGGWANFKTVDRKPAICLNCNRFLIKNYMKKYSKCPVCRKKVTFYNDPSVQIQINKHDTRYLCPKCGKFTLKFLPCGDWD